MRGSGVSMCPVSRSERRAKPQAFPVLQRPVLKGRAQPLRRRPRIGPSPPGCGSMRGQRRGGRPPLQNPTGSLAPYKRTGTAERRGGRTLFFQGSRRGWDQSMIFPQPLTGGGGGGIFFAAELFLSGSAPASTHPSRRTPAADGNLTGLSRGASFLRVSAGGAVDFPRGEFAGGKPAR